MANTGLEIAVIGMAGRFPGANNVQVFWENLKKGIEGISFFSDEELLEAGVDKSLMGHPGYVKARAHIEGKGYFDSTFFGYLPEEAGLMDPQVRVFHECAWQALEDAGCNPAAYPGLIGLYAGAGSSFDWEIFTMISAGAAAGAAVGEVDAFSASQLRSRDLIAARISYKLSLKGPAVFIQTACSTSLVAIHMACRGLLMGESTIALAGGVTLTGAAKKGYLYREGMILSPDGHCRAFDAAAKGTVGGEGAAVVVLKKLKNAIADRDNIMAVIKGSAINNDGDRKVGFTAPGIDGQADVIRMALKMARVEPQTISYIETHGTGTVLGDPIEIQALAHVYGKSKEKYCALGSLKTNTGHLDAAAGAAGFIKTVLALKHRQIPPSLHFEKPNPKIDFENSPFYVNTTLKEWNHHNPGHPLRAGVSSFGIGGTNAHVVLEETPVGRCVGGSVGRCVGEERLIILSARTQTALERMTENLKNYLKKIFSSRLRVFVAISMADIAYTLQTGRKAFPHRKMFICKDAAEGAAILDSPLSGKIKTFTPRKGKKTVVFMFSGQGAQYVNMARGLYEKEPLFREKIDRCFEILAPLMDYDIKNILYPNPPVAKKLPSIGQTSVAQPVIFVIEYALAKLLTAWGITPDLMMGHSIGEYTAACLAGVFSLEHALKLVALRGRLMQNLPPGAMSGVPLAEAELELLLKEHNNNTTAENEPLSLAAVNAPQLCVVSGTHRAIDSFETKLKTKGHNCRRLHTSHAFHSAMMDPIAAEFRNAVEQVSLHPPGMDYISNLTGRPVDGKEVSAADYWVKHLRQTVRFSEGVEFLLAKNKSEGNKDIIFIEAGPGNTLGTFIRRHIPPGSHENNHRTSTSTTTINLVGHPREAEGDDHIYLLDKIGQLWLYGLSPDWEKFYGSEPHQPHKVSLPGYPFEKIEYPAGGDIYNMVREMVQTSRPGTDQPPAPVPAAPAAKPEKEDRPDLPTPYAAPAAPMEKTLVNIWQDFFSIAKIGINDDFFQLGGDSLKAMTLSGKIRRQLDIEIPLADFFACPTIKQLAEKLQSFQKKALPSIQAVEDKEYYPLSSAQKRLYFHHRLNPGSTGYNMPRTYPLAEEIHRHRLEHAFKQLIHRHESLRTSFHTIAETPAQRVHKDVEFTVEYHDLTAKTREDTQRGNDTHHSFIRSFDLAQAPLLRVGLLKTGQNTQLLAVDIHHIIADGTSIGLLFSEFMQLYQGKEPVPLKLRYRDYVQWQQGLFRSGEIKRREGYWLKQFAGEIPALDLPVDYPRPAPGKRTYKGEGFVFEIDEETTGKIKHLVTEEGMTLYVFLLAVFTILLAKYSGKEDIIVGSAAAGRRHPELENLIGMFAGVLTMRNRPRKNMAFIDFLKEVRENAFGAVENQDYPFEELVRALNSRGSIPDRPLFDAAFQLQNMETNETRSGGGGGAHTTGGSIERTSHYDLTMYATETLETIAMQMVYSTELFRPSTAQKMANHYLEILPQVLSDRHILLKDIAITSDLLKVKPDMLHHDPGDFNF